MKFCHLLKLAALGSMLAGIGMSTAYADEALNDLAGRIEYAFYAADERSLQQSLQAMEKLQVTATDSELRTSYLNYGRWKLAQLLTTENPDQAQQVAETCAESKSAKNSKTAGVQHAIVAACLGMLEELRPLRSILYRRDREAELHQALQMDGKLVQVQFIDAWLNANKNGIAQAHAALKQVVEQYSVATTASSAGASWGYAEACYLLGKAELARGNAIAARNALEQALVWAPDYRDAQKLLRSLSLK